MLLSFLSCFISKLKTRSKYNYIKVSPTCHAYTLVPEKSEGPTAREPSLGSVLSFKGSPA